MYDDITIDNLVDFLAKIPGFRDLSRDEIEQFVAPIVSIEVFEAGQNIIKEGSIGSQVFFLYKGRARVDFHPDAEEGRNFFIDEGEIFGEMALVTKEKRTADVVAADRVICLTIDIETFQSVMADHWQITKAVAAMIGERRVERLVSQQEE